MANTTNVRLILVLSVIIILLISLRYIGSRVRRDTSISLNTTTLDSGSTAPIISGPKQSLPLKAMYPIPPTRYSDPNLSNFVNPLLPIFVRIPPDFTTKVPSVLTVEEKGDVVRILDNLSETDAIRNEAASLLHRSKFQDLPQVLENRLDDANEGERFRAFCVQHLGLILFLNDILCDRNQIADRLACLLTDNSRSVRREALLALVRERDYRATAVIKTGLASARWSDSIDLIIRGFAELGYKDRIPEVRPFAFSDDESVRVASIVALASWNDRASIPAFEDACRSRNIHIEMAGLAALRNMYLASQNK